MDLVRLVSFGLLLLFLSLFVFTTPSHFFFFFFFSAAMSNSRGRGNDPHRGGNTPRGQSLGRDSGYHSSAQSTSGQSRSTNDVAMNPTRHATERQVQRNMSDYEIKATLKHGFHMSARGDERFIKVYGLNEVVFVEDTKVEDGDSNEPIASKVRH